MQARRLSASVAVVAGLLACVTPAKAHAPRQPASFDGQCQFAGAVRFMPPIAVQPAPGDARARATGTCTGDLTFHGRTHHVADAAATYVARNHSDLMGCAGGPAAGAGVIRLARHLLRFTLQETRVAAASELHLVGSGWTADGTAAVSSSADPATVGAACAGSGLGGAPVDLSLTFRAS